MQAPSHPEQLFEAGADRAQYVRAMFGDIAARYDLMNALMTVGRHQSWRRAAALELVRPGDRIVDVGSGTGDLALACLDVGARSVLGIDFAGPMLERARTKALAAAEGGALRASFALGDATRLPLASESVDGWCAAFVVRNIPDLDAALAEAYRVVRPGGRLAILEIPRIGPSPLRPAIRVHFRHVVPALGRLVSGHASAYRYLPVSVDHFLEPPELTRKLRGAGFAVRHVELFMLDTVALHVAEKPAR